MIGGSADESAYMSADYLFTNDLSNVDLTQTVAPDASQTNSATLDFQVQFYEAQSYRYIVFVFEDLDAECS